MTIDVADQPSIDKQCRFCLDSDGSINMISPCSCRGSLADVHKKCLGFWMEMRGTDVCNICLTTYSGINYIKREKTVLQFLMQTGAWSYVLGGLLAVVFMLFGMVNGLIEFSRQSRRVELLPMLVIVLAYSFLTVLIAVTFADCSRVFWREFRQWKDAHRQIIVLPEDE